MTGYTIYTRTTENQTNTNPFRMNQKIYYKKKHLKFHCLIDVILWKKFSI